MKNLPLLFIILLFFQFNGISQTKTGIELCIEYQKAISAFSSEKEVNDALDKILNVIGASKNFTLIPCDNISNALAVTFKGDRFILYDGEFMGNINKLTNNWSYLFILAHEVGHHINGHTRDFLLASLLDDQPLEERRNEELEADEFASFIVSKLGASYSQIEETINLISSNKSDLYSTHPSYDKRISAVRRGFDRAYSGSRPTNSSSKNENSAKSRRPNELVLKLENPRNLSSNNFGKWYARKDYPLENILKFSKDPFKRKEYEGSEPIRRLEAETEGKSLSSYGSKNVELSVTIKHYKNNYWKIGKDTYTYFHIPKTSYHINLISWRDYPKEIEFSTKKRTYVTFEYLIDEKISGQFVGQIGWIDYPIFKDGEVAGYEKIPNVIELNGNMSKNYQKQNYDFIKRLKAGKKLHLRFGNIFIWNGFKNGEFDTSMISSKYKIPRYTYEFDLTGSSKALSF